MRQVNPLLILLFISILALFALAGSQVGEATNPSSVLLASTPTPFNRGTLAKATPSPRAKPTSTPTTQPKRVGTTRSPSAPTAFWTPITSEGFEVCSMPCPGWSVVDLSNDGFERYWKDVRYWDGTAYRANSGAWAAWPAAGGADGYSPSINNNKYFDNMDTRMIYGPFDLSDAGDAQVYFYLWREIEPGFDYLTFEVSLDGVNFQELARWDGFVQTWELESISLRNYTGYSRPVGDSRVWVAWRFFSDSSVRYQGPWVDDISIFKLVPGQVTAQGWANYYNRNDARSAARFATVHLFDHNTNGTDYELAYPTNTDQNGLFQFPSLRNWEYWDGGDPNHMLDLYIAVEAAYTETTGTVNKATYISGDTYKWTRQRYDNVPDGTVDLSYDILITDTAKPAMWIYQDLRRAWEYVITYGHTDPGSATATWEAGSNCYPFWPFCGSFFYAPGRFFFIQDIAVIRPDTVVHEDGHNYMFNATNWWWWDSKCWGHAMFASIDDDGNCAWSEGWADFFALLVNGDPCYDFGPGPCGFGGFGFYNLETQNRNDGQAKGDKVEGRVAGALYDLFDNTTDGYDQGFFGFLPIWNIIATAPPETKFRDFSNSWIANGYDLRQSLLAFYQNTIDYLSSNYLPVILK